MIRTAKAALVTGSARRIGRGIALCLAERGYDVALHYHGSEADARETASRIRQAGVGCELFRCNLEDRAETGGLIARVHGEFPGLSLLVNNASVFTRSPIRETGIDFLARHFEVNFFTPFTLARDFAARVAHGSIINLLDTKVAANGSAYAAYTLSKKTLTEFTRMAALEFAPGIRVNGVAPGLILEPAGEAEDYLERMAQKIPLRKKGRVDFIVEAVRYLLENDFVTGQILYVDGGENL